MLDFMHLLAMSEADAAALIKQRAVHIHTLSKSVLFKLMFVLIFHSVPCLMSLC